VPDEVIPSTDAIRFSYEVDGAGALKVVDAVPVAITALLSDDLDPDLGPFTGFWFELRDVDGNVLWRHVTQHPLRGTVETYGDGDLGEPVAGLLPDDVNAPFATIAIPALDRADSVALVGAPPAEPDGAVVELLVHRFEAFVQ
jgi:hypothetical protein